MQLTHTSPFSHTDVGIERREEEDLGSAWEAEMSVGIRTISYSIAGMSDYAKVNRQINNTSICSSRRNHRM